MDGARWDLGGGGLALLGLLVVPLVGALLSPLAREQRGAFVLGVLTMGLELALASALLLAFLAGGGEVPLRLEIPLMSFLELHLVIDGLSALFVPLAALLGLLVVLYAEPTRRELPGAFVGLVCLYELALMGQILAFDALMFCLFGAMELALAAALAARWGTGAERGRAMLRMVELLGGGLLLLGVGFATLASHHADATGRISFDLVDLMRAPLSADRQDSVFFLLFLGLCLRMPLFPFHAWLPVLAQQGTVVVGGVFLMGVKVGALAVARWIFPLLPDAAARNAELAVALGVLSLLYGGVLALVQVNLRRMLAFTVVSHMGAVVIGLFSLNAPGLQGALLLMFSLGLATSGLCFGVGFVYRRTHTSWLPRLGGLFDPMPILGVVFLVLGLTMVAMPGTSGFDAGHLLIEGSYEAHGYAVAGVAALGNLLAAATMLRAYQRAFLAPGPDRPGVVLRDLRLREGLIAGSLCLLIFGVGLAPRPWLGAVTADVLELVAPFEGLREEAHGGH